MATHLLSFMVFLIEILSNSFYTRNYYGTAKIILNDNLRN